MAIADTGASGHYIRPHDPHTTNGTTQNTITVGLPNGDTLQSNDTECALDIPQLPTDARQAHLLPGLAPHSSLGVSIGKLCDAGCEATFGKNKVIVSKDKTTVLTGTSDTRTGLWKFPMRTPEHPKHTPVPTTTFQCASVLQVQTGICHMIKFLHAAAFSPVKSTWITAIKRGYFTTWPGLTTAAVNKQHPQTTATVKGHLDQTRQNLRSTKPKTQECDNEPATDPTQEPHNVIINQVFATVEETGRVYTDQTGQFPVQSSNGHRYMLVLYHFDTNAILVEPLKTRHGNEILRGCTKLYNHLTERGFKPSTHWLDNEASNALKTFNRTQDIEYQLVPPHVHRRNSAERAIRTWKKYFVAGICSTDPAFPLHLWDRIIEQATITLNLLRPARRNPNMSAHQMLNGTFDYNRTPMAPPGTKIIVHEKPKQRRRTWDPHGVDGWYLGPATEHYRCYRVFINKTR
jgi:hypothetical protein